MRYIILICLVGGCAVDDGQPRPALSDHGQHDLTRDIETDPVDIETDPVDIETDPVDIETDPGVCDEELLVSIDWDDSDADINLFIRQPGHPWTEACCWYNRSSEWGCYLLAWDTSQEARVHPDGCPIDVGLYYAYDGPGVPVHLVVDHCGVIAEYSSNILYAGDFLHVGTIDSSDHFTLIVELHLEGIPDD